MISACLYTVALKLLRPELLHELFEHQADSRADADALVCWNERMTYGELEKRANQLAYHLRSRGVKRVDCMAMLLPRSWLSITAVATIATVATITTITTITAIAARTIIPASAVTAIAAADSIAARTAGATRTAIRSVGSVCAIGSINTVCAII